MKAKGEGDIVNVASTAGLKGDLICQRRFKSCSFSVSIDDGGMEKTNIRVITLTPSTIASDMSIQGGLTDGNPDKVFSRKILQNG
jgi:3-oxoacyl-[acyl-carrier protein] reductase